MSGIANFEEFKKDFFTELDEYLPLAQYSIYNQQMKDLFERVEFMNQTQYDSMCRKCKTKFNSSDFTQCPDCGSTKVERNF